MSEYRPVLPSNKDARILDIGCGNGWFAAACRELGYTNVCVADFDISRKSYICDWGVTFYRIEKDIGAMLAQHQQEFDFIHMSHVIEHIPKYSLLWLGDAVYQALKKDGMVYLRTPNMEGPTPNSAFYVTLGHEYGFCGSNLALWLDVCGFDDVHFIHPPPPRTLKQKLGALVRWPFLRMSKLKHRLFGANRGGQFGAELVVTAHRRDCQPFFSEQYR
jgi:2-polyprenyl-3-methyl-5-hydroxy-6-metoxy-1,4-benzoquinol methylase